MSQFWYGEEFFLTVMTDTSGAIGKVGAESWLEREEAHPERDEEPVRKFHLGKQCATQVWASVSLRNEAGQTHGQKWKE